MRRPIFLIISMLPLENSTLVPIGRAEKRGLEVRNGTGSGVAERTKRRRCLPLEDVERVVEMGEVTVVDSGGDESEVTKFGGAASTRTSGHPSAAFWNVISVIRTVSLGLFVEPLHTSKIWTGKASKNSLAITNVCISSPVLLV